MALLRCGESRPSFGAVNGARAVTEIRPSTLSRSSSCPVSSRLFRHHPATGHGCSKKNHPDKSRRCAWGTSGSATFILRTRWAHILQETTSQYFGIGKVRFVLCTCPVRLLNLQAPGAGGTGTCGCSIRFRQMLGSGRRHCRPGHGRAEPGCSRRRPRLCVIVLERMQGYPHSPGDGCREAMGKRLFGKRLAARGSFLSGDAHLRIPPAPLPFPGARRAPDTRAGQSCPGTLPF
ncbi:uncharacterized protein LOC115485340 [Serinus canaria]|uniref:uncharacterized protein LOC115485340 n=1 Tax=Serinus canaria TaxID=9135 RepID=UPI0021CCFC19|nr:uncharacterized protein LOC115485340 [Serinus canaria]